MLGHEFVGDVVEAPDAPAWVGKRVVGEINIGCGACDLCRRGLGKHCRARQSIGIIGRDGAFAEWLTLPIANLHAVPAGVADEQAVFAEPLAAALEILEQVDITGDMRVVVLGDGRLGMLAAQVLALTGCDMLVVGRHADKLAQLANLQIATARSEDTASLRAWGRYADVVVEATGTPGGFAQAREIVRPGGTLVLKSTYAGRALPVNLSDLVVDEITVVGSRCGPFAPALRHLASGRVRTEMMVNACYGLDEGVAALAHAGRPGVLKVLIRP